MVSKPSLEEQLEFIHETDKPKFTDFYEFFYSIDDSVIESVEEVVESEHIKPDNKTRLYEHGRHADQMALRELSSEGYIEKDLNEKGEMFFELTDKGKNRINV